MKDAIPELGRLLEEAGARVTFDPERSIAKPCIVCGTTEQRWRNYTNPPE